MKIDSAFSNLNEKIIKKHQMKHYAGKQYTDSGNKYNSVLSFRVYIYNEKERVKENRENLYPSINETFNTPPKKSRSNPTPRKQKNII